MQKIQLTKRRKLISHNFDAILSSKYVLCIICILLYNWSPDNFHSPAMVMPPWPGNVRIISIVHPSWCHHGWTMHMIISIVHPWWHRGWVDYGNYPTKNNMIISIVHLTWQNLKIIQWNHFQQKNLKIVRKCFENQNMNQLYNRIQKIILMMLQQSFIHKIQIRIWFFQSAQ